MNKTEQIFNTEALSAREQVTDWFDLKEKLGNRVAGEFLGFWQVPARGVFRAQVGIALKDFEEPNRVWGVNLPAYFEEQLALYRVSDEVGAEFFKIIPAKEVGMNDTKAIRLFNITKLAREKEGIQTTPSKPEIVKNDSEIEVVDLTSDKSPF